MEHLKLDTIHKDERGSLFSVTHKYCWAEINFLETVAGVTRGNHYHKFTKELFYILSGKIQVSTYDIITKETNNFEALPNTAFIINPYEVHTFEALIKSTWLNMLSQKFDDLKPDMYKYPS